MTIYRVTLENGIASVAAFETTDIDSTVEINPYESPDNYYFILDNDKKKAIHKNLIGKVSEHEHARTTYLTA